MPSYVKFETPKELVPQILEMLSVAKDGGKIKKGVNETTKSIERKTAQFVIIAEDVTPEEVVVHLPMLCEQHGIPFAYIPTKVDLGRSVGIQVGTSSLALENAGGANEKLHDILKRLPKQSGVHEKPAAGRANNMPSGGTAKTAAPTTKAPVAKPAEKPKAKK